MQGNGDSNRHLLKSFLDLPMQFEGNRGQFPRTTRFLARGPGYTLALTSQGARLSLLKGNGRERAEVGFELIGGRPSPQIAGRDEAPGKTSYFLGSDPSKWQTRVPSYSRVVYRDVYSGIDLIFRGTGRDLEYDFKVDPGANPRQIRFQLTGGEVSLNSMGQLVVRTPVGKILQDAPVAYQMHGSRRQRVNSRFILSKGNHVGFRLGQYDPDLPLIIDPKVSYSTYYGGNTGDTSQAGLAVAVDKSGNAYITGRTAAGGLPLKGNPKPYQEQKYDYTAAFVAKFNPNAKRADSLMYSTYLGSDQTGTGSAGTIGLAIGVDDSENAFIGGHTDSNSFPVVDGFQAAPRLRAGQLNGGAFVARLNSQGSGLSFASYLGGRGDQVESVAIDPSGLAFVTGGIAAGDVDATSEAFQSNHGGGARDGFIARIDPDSADPLQYFSYFGGTGNDVGKSVALNPSGRVFIAGLSDSPPWLAAAGFRTTNAGGLDAYLVGLDLRGPRGNALGYFSYFGGLRDDIGTAVVADKSGKVYLSGMTGSPDLPTRNSYQRVFGGGIPPRPSDIFIAAIDPKIAGDASLLWSTFLGGSGQEGSLQLQQSFAPDLALDEAANVYVSGSTTSINFPTLHSIKGPIETAGLCAAQVGDPVCPDAFVAKFDTIGRLVYSTLVGGNQLDEATAIRLDGKNGVHLTGSTSGGFPVDTEVSFESSQRGRESGFFAKLVPILPVLSELLPDRGPVIGGTPVTIKGVALAGADNVDFGGVDIPKSSFSSLSDTEINLSSPPRARPESVAVTVETFEGPSDPKVFTYEALPEAPPTPPADPPSAGPSSEPVKLLDVSPPLTPPPGADTSILISGQSSVSIPGGASPSSLHAPPSPPLGNTAPVIVSGGQAAPSSVAADPFISPALTPAPIGSGSIRTASDSQEEPARRFAMVAASIGAAVLLTAARAMSSNGAAAATAGAAGSRLNGCVHGRPAVKPA